MSDFDEGKPSMINAIKRRITSSFLDSVTIFSHVMAKNFETSDATVHITDSSKRSSSDCIAKLASSAYGLGCREMASAESFLLPGR